MYITLPSSLLNSTVNRSARLGSYAVRGLDEDVLGPMTIDPVMAEALPSGPGRYAFTLSYWG